ncbi:hypothetical protein M422DRAFT_25920, partial [Sphaerobolus stellatus SS14]
MLTALVSAWSTISHRFEAHVHPTLPIELQELVFTFCQKSTIFSASLVCKLWLQPVLNILWKDVPHPIVLFRLLKPWNTEVNPKGGLMSKFSRGLMLTDWEAFDRYAFRVRSLDWSDSDITGITNKTKIALSTVIEIARVRPRLALLPALRKLSMSSEHMDYISLFLPPGLLELDMHFYRSYTDSRGVQGVRDLLLLIPTMASNLQILDLNCSYPISHLMPACTHMLRLLSSLRKVVFPRYWHTDWVTLASLRNFEEFDYQWEYYPDAGGDVIDVVGFYVPLQNHSFPVLSKISMELDFPVLQKFLADSAFLEQLGYLGVRTIHRARPNDIRDLFQVLAKRGKSLTRLDLDGFPTPPVSSTVMDTIDMSVLEPLLHCSTLTDLWIQYPTQVQLSDDDLRIVGTKLPKLKSLSIVERPFYDDPPLLDMSIFFILEEHFPSLESVGLYVDGDLGYEDSNRSVRPLPKLRKLTFGLSPLDKENAADVAFFSSGFLTVRGDQSTAIDISSNGWFLEEYDTIITQELADEREEWEESWKMVGTRTKQMVLARDEDRRMADELKQEVAAL